MSNGSLLLSPGVPYVVIPQCAQDMCLGWVPWMGYPYPTEYNLQLQPRGPDNPIWYFLNQDQSPAGFGDNRYGENIAFESVNAVATLPGGESEASTALTFAGSNSPVTASLLMLSDSGIIDARQRWNIAVPSNTYDNPGWWAIQNCADTSQNLNVAGDGPYPAGTGILAWDWGGGAPNEVWMIFPA